MIALATCYFVAGLIAGGWLLTVTEPKSVTAPTTATEATGTPGAAISGSVPIAPTLKENYTGPIFPTPQLHFDPTHAVLPDSRLTPGDVSPEVAKDDVCTPG